MNKKGYDKKYYMKYREENRERLLEYSKRYRIENKEKESKRIKKYYIENRESMLKYQKQYRIKNRELLNNKNKQYYLDNHERLLKKDKLYQKNNLEKVYLYKKNRYKTNLKYNLNRRLSCLIWQTLKDNKNGRHWENLLGYSVNDLIRRLKRTMPKGYNWQDFLEGKLHIDHITPIKVFNFTKAEHIDFQRCWALNNLRLLPAKENLIKGSKLSRPFQPALKI